MGYYINIDWMGVIWQTEWLFSLIDKLIKKSMDWYIERLTYMNKFFKRDTIGEKGYFD